MLQEGDRVGRYTVRAVLGQGGMAVVYRVRHTQLGSDHALKVLTGRKAGVRQRLIKEGQAQAQLRHPNIVAVTDVLEVHGAPALVMEYVDGPDLGVWLQQRRPDLETALHIFRGILAGVRRAHRAGLIHRDLKPGNVLMATDGTGVWLPRVADFGLVKALDADGVGQTRTGLGMGTPAFMAPEQYRSAKDTDHRTDIFSLGCILYWLVCGRPPFVGGDMYELMSRIHQAGFPPPRQLVPGLPDAVDMAIRGALEPNRDRRHADCDTLLSVLAGDSSWPAAPGDDGHTLDFDGFGPVPAAEPADSAEVAAIRAAETQPAPSGLFSGDQTGAPFAHAVFIDDGHGEPGTAAHRMAAATMAVPPDPHEARSPPLMVGGPPGATGRTAVPLDTQDSQTTLDPDARPVAPAAPPRSAPLGSARPQSPGPPPGIAWGLGAIVALALAGLGAWTAGFFDAPPVDAVPAMVAPGPGAPTPAGTPDESGAIPSVAPPVDSAPRAPPRGPTTEAPPAERVAAPATPRPRPARGTRSGTADPQPEASPSATEDATLTAEGGGLVRLIRDGASHRPGLVSPGTYAITATFGGSKSLPAGSITLEPGESVTLRCNALLKTCQR